VIQPNAGTILDLAYTSDGAKLTIVTEEGLFSLQNNHLKEKLYWPLNLDGYDVAVSPDGKLVATSGTLQNKTGVHLWDVASGQHIRTLITDTQGRVNTPAFSKDSQWLAGNIDEGPIAIWDVNSGQLIRTIFDEDLADFTFRDMAFSPNGEIISGASTSLLYLWSLETGELTIAETQCNGDVTYDQVYSPNSKTLLFACGISGYPLGFLSIWDVPGQYLRDYWHECGSIHSLAYSPDGEMAALGYYDGTLMLWSEDDQSFYWLGHCESRESWMAYDKEGNVVCEDHEVTALAFSPNSERLASGSLDGRVIVWDVSRLKLPQSPSGCTLRAGREIRVGEDARLWSHPDVSKGSITLELIPGQSIYVLSGPVFGPILKDRSVSGWFWEVSLSLDDSSAGWIWEGRLEECQ
jgi:WD40 repeat protein